jgi:lysophospholipase L1-like esterase
MKPPRILVFILSVFLLLLVISFLFPEEGLRISKNHRLHFLTVNELLTGDTVQYADISGIISQSTVINEDTLVFADPVIPAQVSTFSDTVRANEDSLKLHVHRIEYPGGDSTVLYPVFRQLQQLGSGKKLIRIAHYGDSQIEGDRMTSFIRNRLQKRFGGSGVGLMPAVELYGYQGSFRHTASDNWLRYTAFGNIDTTLSHDRYGMMASFARFVPYTSDSMPPDTTTREAWINLTVSERTYALNKEFSQCRLLYGHSDQPVLVECLVNGNLFDADILTASEQLNIKKWTFGEAPREIILKFKGSGSPDFYGIALDGRKGVAVDNIAMRGCAGLVFTAINRDLLEKMIDTLDVRMLILQFGGNVVPYMTDNYDYYGRWFLGQLRRLKQISPDMPIIVIGVSDMSIRDKDKFVTYPNLVQIRDALKDATFKAGCAYWDMYEAMGGYNSMPSWVNAEPALATSDFVHFNERGARVIAEMFYNAFIYEYDKYAGEREPKTAIP